METGPKRYKSYHRKSDVGEAEDEDVEEGPI